MTQPILALNLVFIGIDHVESANDVVHLVNIEQ